VDIVDLALSRKKLEYHGKHFELPLPDGPGKRIQLTVHPVRERIPVYLAAVGPKNLELAGEIADGWLAVFFSPQHSADQLASIKAGREKAGKTMEGFDVVPTVPIVVDEDVERAAELVRWYAALYIGGMGSREQNFYNQLACRMGFEKEAARVQELYLAREHRNAAAAVPLEFVDATCLLGSPERIARRMAEFEAAGVTTLSLSPFAATLDERLAALGTAARLSGVAA
jgi:alkanesulfonate monooxygenase SsuD/methylene tetrahydromethanopterin reductase-like flavin-dependent oxidoreductase (luciferase family)